MTRTQRSARGTPRRGRWLVVGGLVVAAAIIALLVPDASRTPSASPSASATAAPPSRSPASVASPSPAPSASASPPSHPSRGADLGALDEADGVVPDGVTVFDDTVAAVANLNPRLLDAVRRAARDAAAEGVTFYVNSGWRSPRYQDELLRQAVATHGTEEEAARWVATATTSPHVLGDAVDLGDSAATAWLTRSGARYGLCQIYENEPWHYELRAAATGHGCPRMYADASRDPRTRR
ncbi:D-alanyl-D-alanine carboxypeptidase family protein [Streptomyces sp. NPDC057702]|uniref:D-alanyl-D-alanine carboxypeptidase family protein n=1 Tax=unclassified Streptomyces TaxID=2593676 RepID=UPI0036C19AB1